MLLRLLRASCRDGHDHRTAQKDAGHHRANRKKADRAEIRTRFCAENLAEAQRGAGDLTIRVKLHAVTITTARRACQA